MKKGCYFVGIIAGIFAIIIMFVFLRACFGVAETISGNYNYSTSKSIEQLKEELNSNIKNGEWKEANDLIFEIKSKYPEDAKLMSAKIDSVTLEYKKMRDKYSLLAKQACANMTKKHDEFEKITWVRDRTSPVYTNQNGIFLYFSQNDSAANNLRLRIQLLNDDWIFLKSYTFLIDGETYEYDPRISRDNDHRVWEWSDQPVNSNNKKIIDKILESKSAKIRFQGRQYHKDKTITKSQITAMQRVYDAYMADGCH